MEDGFDISELQGFEQNLINDMAKKYPKEMRKFMRKEANKVQEIAKGIAEAEIKKDTGNYLAGFKVGKSKLKGAYSIKAYNEANHAHLIEDGYNQVARGEDKKKGMGRRVGTKPTGKFVEGKHIYSKAHVKFKSQFESDVQKFADDLLYHSVCAKYGQVKPKH
jgi:hypothetical protein